MFSSPCLNDPISSGVLEGESNGICLRGIGGINIPDFLLGPRVVRREKGEGHVCSGQR